MSKRGIAVLLAVGLVAVSGEAAAGSDGCHPTYIELSDGPLKLEAGLATWEVEALIIGCEAELQALSNEQKRGIVDVLATIFKKQDLLLLEKLHTEEFRRDLCSQIEQELNAKIVWDVAFVGAKRWG